MHPAEQSGREGGGADCHSPPSEYAPGIRNTVRITLKLIKTGDQMGSGDPGEAEHSEPPGPKVDEDGFTIVEKKKRR